MLFELGLIVVLVPLAWWLSIGLVEAFLLDMSDPCSSPFTSGL